MTRKLFYFFVKLFSGTFFALILIEISLQLISVGLKTSDTKSLVSPSEEKMIRILAIGESTTATQYNSRIITAQPSQNIQAWPSQLESLLKKNHYSARVYNLGLPATNTNLILHRIKDQIALYRPHIVISMMGINDSNLWLNERETSYINKLIIVKIANWIWNSLPRKSAQKSLQQSNNGIPFQKNLIFKNSETVLNLFKQNKKTQAQKLMSESINGLKNIEQAQYYAFLANSLLPPPGSDSSAFINSYDLYKLSHQKYFWIDTTIESFGHVLVALGKADECLELAKAYTEKKGAINDFILSLYGSCSSKSKNKAAWKLLFDQLPLNLNVSFTDKTSHTTKNNYRKLYNLLAQKNISLIAMQYPLNDIRTLKYYFHNGTDFHQVSAPYDNIVFVDNRENFQAALNAHSYDKLFIDQFGGFFGHTTNLGHELLAKSAYEKVVEVISKLKLDHQMDHAL